MRTLLQRGISGASCGWCLCALCSASILEFDLDAAAASAIVTDHRRLILCSKSWLGPNGTACFLTGSAWDSLVRKSLRRFSRFDSGAVRASKQGCRPRFAWNLESDSAAAVTKDPWTLIVFCVGRVVLSSGWFLQLHGGENCCPRCSTRLGQILGCVSGLTFGGSCAGGRGESG